jgi:rod shape-determining protein MreC
VAVTRRTSRSRFTLVLLVLTSITLLTLDSRGFGPLDSARRAMLSVFAPVGDFTAGVFRPVGDAWSGAFSGTDLQSENEELKREISDLHGKITQGEASRLELENLKKALAIPLAGDQKREVARVSSGAISNFDETIEIDKGSTSGIEKGMPVMSDGGLIGSVQETSDGRSVVRLITDRTFQVGISVVNGAGRGIIQGQGDQSRVRAAQFDIRTELAPGNILVTSGVARSQFPPGIPVGTIESVGTDDTTQQKTADVKLSANLNDLTWVTVVLYKPKDS